MQLMLSNLVLITLLDARIFDFIVGKMQFLQRKVYKGRCIFLCINREKSCSFSHQITKMAEQYSARSIKDVRDQFDVVELSKKIKRQGDVLILSNELKIKPRILNLVKDEGRVLSIFPKLEKSKAGVLARLRTDRELKLFAGKYDVFNTSVRSLRKLVGGWNKDLQDDPLLLISQGEHDLIIGSLLGDSSIRQRERNSCFRFSHSIKQKKYCEFKNNLLKEFNISEFREVKRRFGESFIRAIDFSTKTHSVFNYYRNLFYKNGRKVVTQQILNQLNPRSLAFWICDDGSYDDTQGYVILCTNSYSLGEHKLMKEFFNKRFKLDLTIGLRDGRYYYLRFKKNDSEKLIEIIRPFIPDCMKYKLGGVKNGF